MAIEKICGIYCIENLINGKKYIGLSKNIYKRWSDHKYRLNINTHENIHLQRAWVKFGDTNFKFSIIDKCDIDSLPQLEEYYIKFYKSNNYDYGYNITSGGENGNINEDSFENAAKNILHRGLRELSMTI